MPLLNTIKKPLRAIRRRWQRFRHGKELRWSQLPPPPPPPVPISGPARPWSDPLLDPVAIENMTAPPSSPPPSQSSKPLPPLPSAASRSGSPEQPQPADPPAELEMANTDVAPIEYRSSWWDEPEDFYRPDMQQTLSLSWDRTLPVIAGFTMPW